MNLYVTLENLSAYAASTARTLPVTGTISPRYVVRGGRWTLLALRRRERRTGTGELTAAERWLRDNLYLAEREGREAMAAFARAPRLRRCEDGALITALCRVLLAVSGGAADEERTAAFLRGFQTVTVLRGEELRLFPAALRLAAAERLSALYAQTEPSAAEAEALFTTLRRLSALDLGPLLEAADRTAAALSRDPAGVYPRMDEQSRAAYRRQVERLARKSGLSEHRTAERAVELAAASATERTRHVGYYLFADPLGQGTPERSAAGYTALNLTLPPALSVLLGWLLGSAWAALLLVLPLSELVKNGIDRLLLRLTPPRHVPRLELKEGVPPEGRTLCVSSVLLTGEDTGEKAARHLEEYRMAARDCGENLLFGLLCDLPESDEAFTGADRERLNAAAAAVEALNRRCGGGFFLLSRERSWSADTEQFAPWERKRGAMVELCRFLAGEGSRLELGAGERAELRDVRYVLTLDADTRLEPEAARALIGAALHPLNAPVADPVRGVVTEGHALFQPRMEVRLPDAVRTPFSRLFAPGFGADPYGGDTGEVYMDVFASGGFAGKGLLDVRAYLDCMDRRVPDGLMLSHDAVEGAFLRGAFVGDVALTDGFPASPLSFFSRQHRWVRGDWQNLPWLGKRGRALPLIERWRLFDSLRRSLAPAGVMAALGAGLALGGGAMSLCAGVALGAAVLPYLQELWGRLFQPRADAELRIRARVLHGPGETLLRPLSRLVLLPMEAWTDLSAAVTALWRLCVSGKRRLQWKTAAESENSLGSLAACCRAMAVPAAFGLLLLAFGGTVAGRAAGAVWLLAPLWARTLGRVREDAPLPEEDRAFLKERAGEIWGYFADECRPETNFLPPDNVQYEPPAEKAERVSPTNLGLTVLSALCAAELSLIDKGTAADFCARLLGTAEKLERWEGHFYNWYDTRTLAPLEPRYVSTVDSGNLAACLLTAAAGLRALGEPVLAARAEALRLAMDFRPLFDEKRQLFRIGLRPGEDAPAQSWYDLLESEERLTGYLCVACGQVSLKHWRRLGRAQVSFRGFRGMVSWSGTMFEYLMPELLLPLYPDSHLGESARFALYVQRCRAVGPYKLWGESESAFAALDAAMHYRYKAHGAPALSLCRDGAGEHVIAPYSAYLALLVSPRAAMADLRAMERAGLLGPRGFWEAVDFTPGRDSGGEGTAVRSVMVHHLGMSLCAVTNLLCDNVLRRWFLSDPAMAAYTGLLQERIPLGGALLRRREERRPRPDRVRADGVVREGEGVGFLRPAAGALSNGAYHLLFTASGVSRPRWGSLTPYASPAAPWEESHGLELRLRRGGETISLLPRRGDGVSWRWSFSDSEARLSGEGSGLRWSVAAAVSAMGAGERREITLRREDAGTPAVLELSFEPVLLPERDRRSHPSFARLGMETRELDGALLLRRLPRGSQGEKFLAAGCSARVSFASDRHGGPPGWQSEPYITIRAELPAGEEESRVVFALCCAGEERDALALLPELLREQGGFSAARVCASLWKMDATEIKAAWERLPWLCWPALSPQAAAMPAAGREALWKWGISGDLPIHGFPCAGVGAVNAAAAEAKRHALLAVSGVACDLVFLPADDADYRRSLRSRIESVLAEMELGGTVGARGGVHFAPPEALEAVRAASALWTGPEGLELPETAGETPPALPPTAERGTEAPEVTFDPGGAVSFTAGETLPRRAWQHLLTDGTVGWLCTEAGTGSLWYKNARECPLIPWRGDPLAVSGPEELWAETDSGPLGFFAGRGGRTRVTYDYGTAVWETQAEGLTLRLTACVPWQSGVRLFLLESSAPCTVRWCAPLALAPEPEDAPACTVRREGEALTAVNPRCPWPELRLTARLSVPWDSTGTDAAALLMGGEAAPGRGAAPALGGSFSLNGEAVLLLGTDDRPELLDPAAARKAMEDTRRQWRDRLGTLRARGPETGMLPLLNGWSAWQAMSFRLLGRASLYQSGGAVGFRDQLQDYVNLLPLDPAGCRAHILACCAHQFREGDVQHWWHPGPGVTDKGVRTRCSDDLLWLPWAVGEYVRATGDKELLNAEAPYLAAPPLGPGENSRYETPQPAPEQGTVWDHCLRAAQEVLRRGVGAHRLLLMGSGDWNDGFDAMGEGAESVWLSFFASAVLDAMADLAPDRETGDKLRRTAEMLGRAADGAWDGDHYLRGYYGDGTPLGAAAGENCRMDSVAQSFAAFCPWADRERVNTALDSALSALWERERQIVRLYTPPVGPGERSPGYVAGYGPGFRENGGQYTHAAVWLARACFRMGRWQEGAGILRDLAASPGLAGYGGEPWLLPADVYTAPGQVGRAGWTGYTGAAGWWYRTAWEDMLGRKWTGGPAEIKLPAPAKEAGWQIE